MADDRYEIISTETFPTAEEIARRNLERIKLEEARKAAFEKRVKKRQKELADKAYVEDVERKRKAAEQKAKEAPSGPVKKAGSIGEMLGQIERAKPKPVGPPTLSDMIGGGNPYNSLPEPRDTFKPKTVTVDGVETPFNDAEASIPERLKFEEELLRSPLKQRALRRARTEELIAQGMNPIVAEERSLLEQEGRYEAYQKGREKSAAFKGQGAGGFVEKEGSGVTHDVLLNLYGPAVRLMPDVVAEQYNISDQEQLADEMAAFNAGIQSDLEDWRNVYSPYPEIQGAAAGAASNTVQMTVGIGASAVAGPQVGMGVMAAQYGLQEYNRALYEGKEAGLVGDELDLYAKTQATIEASIMPAFSLAGLGGLEGRVLRGAVAKSVMKHPTMMAAVKSGFKQSTKSALEELAEEVTTELSHGFADQAFLDREVDFDAIVKQTVLQTAIMMAGSEGGVHAQTAIAGMQQRAQEKRNPQAPAETPQADQVTQEQEQPQEVPPEVLAFLESPSRKKYEAAVKAGLPRYTSPDNPEDDLGKSIEGRALYAEEMKRRIFPDQAPADEAAPAEEMPQETPPGIVPEVDTDEVLNILGRTTDETVEGEQQGQQEQQQGEQGRQEGLLATEEQPSGIEGVSDPEPANDLAVPDSTTPSVREQAFQEAYNKASGLTKEEFDKQYRDTYQRMISYGPDQAGSSILADEMAAMYDAHPDWAAELENTKDTQTAPVTLSGESSPDQPEASLAGPALEQQLSDGDLAAEQPQNQTGPVSVQQPDVTQPEAPVTNPVDQPLPEFLALPQKSQDLFNTAFESKDVDKLKEMVQKNNRAWNAEFQRRTGIKLPKTQKDRNQAVLDWAAPLGKPASEAGPQESAEPRRGVVGDMLKAGEVVKTSSGRSTTPFPKIDTGTDRKAGNTVKRVDEWLHANAIAEAESRGDDFNAVQFRNEKPGKMPPATKDAMEEYLFGEQPKVVSSILKPLVSPSEDSEKVVPWRQQRDETRPAYNKRMKASGWTQSPKPSISVLDSPDRVREMSLEKQKNSPYKKGDRVTVYTGFSTDEMQIGGEVIEDSLPESPTVKVRVDSGKVHYVQAYYLGRDKPAEKSPEKPQTTKPQAEKPAEPSQEDLMEQILREELLGETAKPQKERKPRTPKAETAEPKAPRKPRVEAAKKRTERTAAELKAAEDEIRKAFGSTANMGLNADQMRATARLVKAALNHQVSTFNEFVAYVVDTFGEPMALRMADGIELAWRTLRRLPEYSGVDDAGSVADVVAKRSDKTPEATGWNAVPAYFANQLANGKEYKSITEARKEAGDLIGQPIKPGTAEAKTLDEAIEYGVVQAARQIVAEGGTSAEIYDKLVDLYSRQPTLGVRDSKSMILQAYSTPVPLAYLASRMANVTADSTVYEPTAGNGMLLIEVPPENAFANELDPARAKTLKDQGFNVTENDAVTHEVPSVDAVIANPPFGRVKDENGNTKTFVVDGITTKEVDHAIVLQSLKAMKPDGHAVLIIAAKGHDAKNDMERRQAYAMGAARPFYDALYQGYDVVSHITVDGSLYSKQGASFPVDVIVVRPQGTVRADQKRSTPWAMVPQIFKSWKDLKNGYGARVLADSGTGQATSVRAGERSDSGSTVSTRNSDDVGRVPGQNENTTQVDEGNVGPAKPEPVVSTPTDAKDGSGRGSTKPRGTRAESGVSRPSETERSGQESVSDAGTPSTGSKNVNRGTRPDGMAGDGTADAQSDVAPESHQTAYQPSSGNKTVDTLTPTNLQNATRRALEAVEDAYGPVDAFVQKELGYAKDDPYFNDMSAEQVDAIALAIYSHKNGSGMIVGDMTGVGKGRVAAAMMRYADKNGMVPVFVTEKPDLFGDIYRDLIDIGSDTADYAFNAVTTKNTTGKEAIDLPNGRKLKMSSETSMAMMREGIQSLADGKGFVVTVDGKPQKVDAIFTMYSQLQTLNGRETERRALLRQLMPNSFLILDESHNAGGTVKERVNENAPPDRAAYAREIVQLANGVLYSSATFAKRPDVMDLYSRTDMAKAVDGDIRRLASVVREGGLPLQQVVSAMLAESGQYIRREKSFEGIEFAKTEVNVDLEEQDRITEVFRMIRNLDSVVAEVVQNMNDDLVAAGEMGFSGDVSTGDAGLVSTSFSSILWNAVDQMLFALKADKAADEAIAAWKRGEVPVLAVDNTMESIVDEYVEANGLKPGDVVKLSFRDILNRYLERSRWMTVDTGQRNERGKKITRKERLTDDQLNTETHLGNALELFNQVMESIDAVNIKAPASPIDWLRYRMQKEGMKISEVTGRSTVLMYNDNGDAVLAARPKDESGTRGKQNTIRKINDGTLDAMILNRSGSTGLSIHASAKFKNQKVRNMIIVQPAKNIDEFMQMLGRVNRTGQVVKPKYVLLASDSPAELRPAAVLSKKLSSLNASVTAKSKGAVGFDVTDVMNEVGGTIVQQYLRDNPEFAMLLEMEQEDESENEDRPSEAESLEEIVRKATGRSAILPISLQREFWDDITAAYNSRIEELNAMNANPLIAQTMDLDAKTLSSINVFPGKPDEGPFAAPADLERVDIKSIGKPMSSKQVTDKILEFYGIEKIDDRFAAERKWIIENVQMMKTEIEPYRKEAMARFVNDEAKQARSQKLDEQMQDVQEAMRDFPPGTPVAYVMEGMPFQGVVIGFSRTGKTGNPVAPSRWVIEIAIDDAAKKVNVPVSRSGNSVFAATESLDKTLSGFDSKQITSRQKRWIGTGNIVAAYAQLSAAGGKLVFYTDDQGDTKRGILMPKSFDATTFLASKPVGFENPADMLTYFDRKGSRLTTADGVLVVVMREPGVLMLVAPKARSRGGKYTLNRGITEAAGADFVSAGNQMSLVVRGRQRQIDTLAAVMDISPLEAKLESDREVARDVLGLTKTGAKIQQETEEDATPATAPQEPVVTPEQAAADKAREELDALRRLNAQYDKLFVKEWKKLISSPASGITITDEMARAIAGRIVTTIKAGVKSFEVMIRDMRANVAEDVLRGMKPNLIRTWNTLSEKHGLEPASDLAFETAMNDTQDVDIEQAAEAAKGAPLERDPSSTETTPAESQPAAESQPYDGKLYSTKNAFSAQQRQELGMPERPAVPRLEREPSIEMAAAEGQTRHGADRIDALIMELTVNPRVVSPYENDLLNFRNAELGNKLDAALRKQIDARKSGDSAQEAIAALEASTHRTAKKTLIESVLEMVGTLAGRALQARKAVIADDYSMSRLSLEYEAAYGEPPSTEKLQEMQKMIDELNAAVEALEKKQRELEAKNEDLEKRLQEAHDSAVSGNAAPSAPAESGAVSAPKPGVLETMKERGRNRIKSAKKTIMEMLRDGKLYSLGGALGDAGKVFIELATGYTEIGIATTGEFLKQLKRDFGPSYEKIKDPALAAFNEVRQSSTNGELEDITGKLDITDPDTIGRVARALHGFVIRRDGLDASPTGRQAAVDAVHEILADLIPGITAKEVARAMSGIGVYSELNKDEAEVVRRDQKAQLLMLEQISDWKQKKAPPKTGQERDEMSEEQRILRKAVEEAKKASGISTTTPGQLRSALDAAKRMAANRIKDLTRAIEENDPLPKRKTMVDSENAELKALRAQRDALQKLYNETFGRNQLTDEQRVARAEKAMDKAIETLEADLKAGKLYNDNTRAPVTSPAIEAKRAQMDALKASREELRLQSGQAQARSDAAYERHLREKDARLAQRIADGDFAPRPKKPERVLTPEALKLMLAVKKKQQQINQKIREWEFERAHPVYKVFMWGPATASAIIRKGLTSIDQSLIGRQGYLLGITNWGIYRQSIRKAFPSKPFEAKSIFPTEQDLFNTEAELDADENWVRLEKIGRLAVTGVHGGMTREEQNMGVPEWVNTYIPGVAGSERAGSAFINTLRRLVFRSLVDKLSKTLDGNGRKISNADLRVIANFVNVSTGRGDIKAMSSALTAMSHVFFSPRWWLSRLQWWSGYPMWYGSRWVRGEGASTEVRQLIAKEMGKQVAAQGIIIGIVTAALAAAFGAPGDDEEWDFYWNPTHAHFGKIRVGNTMFDMTAGLGQHLSYFARVISGRQEDRWEVKETDKWRVSESYGRGKLAPIPGMVVDYLAGSSMGGEKFGSKEWIASKVLPLSIQDVLDASEKEGMPLAAVASALMFFGIGAQSRDEEMKSRKDAINEVRTAQKQNRPQAEILELMDKHFAEQAAIEAKEELRTTDDPEKKAALESVISGTKSPELDAAIQKEKGDLALIAAVMLSTEDRTQGKSANDDKAIETARNLLKTIAPTYEEANAIYTDGYKRRNGSVTEIVGSGSSKRFQLKKSVAQARRRLKLMYQN